MMKPHRDLDLGTILRLWAPLAATWLMMACEGPFLAAVIARRPEAEGNLAAFGVALAVAMFTEAPVIMMMSASTALVTDRGSFRALRRFSLVLNVLVTLAIGALLLPPVFRLVCVRAMALPPAVARLTRLGTMILLPWPAAIGYRRFYQGVLIRRGETRKVAYGTLVRLAAMAGTALTVAFASKAEGVVIGAAALSAGVVAEAGASRFMARQAVLDVCREEIGAVLRTGSIVRFYVPLALTSLLTLGARPVIAVFVGRSRLALESLAILPVLNGLVFIHRSPGFAFQEVGIALLAPSRQAWPRLRAFGRRLELASSGLLALIASTPLAHWWFEGVSGLAPELGRLSMVPLRILVLLPALEVVLSMQRALLVSEGLTRRITAATVIEVTVLVAVLALATGPLSMVGVTATACAAIVGRVVANAFLGIAARGRRVGCLAGVEHG
jgi:hypothetical protein